MRDAAVECDRGQHFRRSQVGDIQNQQARVPGGYQRALALKVDRHVLHIPGQVEVGPHDRRGVARYVDHGKATRARGHESRELGGVGRIRNDIQGYGVSEQGLARDHAIRQGLPTQGIEVLQQFCTVADAIAVRVGFVSTRADDKFGHVFEPITIRVARYAVTERDFRHVESHAGTWRHEFADADRVGLDLVHVLAIGRIRTQHDAVDAQGGAGRYFNLVAQDKAGSQVLDGEEESAAGVVGAGNRRDIGADLVDLKSVQSHRCSGACEVQVHLPVDHFDPVRNARVLTRQGTDGAAANPFDAVGDTFVSGSVVTHIDYHVIGSVGQVDHESRVVGLGKTTGQAC